MVQPISDTRHGASLLIFKKLSVYDGNQGWGHLRDSFWSDKYISLYANINVP